MTTPQFWTSNIALLGGQLHTTLKALKTSQHFKEKAQIGNQFYGFSSAYDLSFGGVDKPRGQTRGVAQMTTTLNNSYLVKVST